MKKTKLIPLLHKSIYLGLGLIYILGGLIALIKPTNLVPQEPDIPSSVVIDYVRQLQDNSAHLAQELGISILTIGVLFLWIAFNINKSKGINYVLLVFFILFAGIHWFEFFQENRNIISPIVNSIPLVLGIFLISTQKIIAKEL